MQFDFALAWESLPALLGGAAVTMSVTLPVMLFGAMLAVPVALARLSKKRIFNIPAAIYIAIFRGAPSLVILYQIYAGLAQVSFVRNGPLWFIFSSAYACAVLGFSLNHSGYVAEIVRGGLLSVPKGLTEAASALGLSRGQIFWKIRLPLAVRLGWRAYQNEVLIFMKSTSVISAITLVDLTAVANEIFYLTYDPFTPIITAAAIYWALTNIMRLGFDVAESRMNVHLKVKLENSPKRAVTFGRMRNATGLAVAAGEQPASVGATLRSVVTSDGGQ